MEPVSPGLPGARTCMDVLRDGSRLAVLHGPELLGEALGRLGRSDQEATKSSLAALRDCLTRMLLPPEPDTPQDHTSQTITSQSVSV
jgi:hypothetical protein